MEQGKGGGAMEQGEAGGEGEEGRGRAQDGGTGMESVNRGRRRYAAVKAAAIAATPCLNG